MGALHLMRVNQGVSRVHVSRGLKKGTWEEAVGALHLVGVVLVPRAQRQRAQRRRVRKLQVGKVPVQQPPLQHRPAGRHSLACLLLLICLLLQVLASCRSSGVLKAMRKSGPSEEAAPHSQPQRHNVLVGQPAGRAWTPVWPWIG